MPNIHANTEDMKDMLGMLFILAVTLSLGGEMAAFFQADFGLIVTLHAIFLILSSFTVYLART